MTNLNYPWLTTLLPNQYKMAITAKGKHFLFKFLFKKGGHLFICGNSGSGKTQKGYWLCSWFTKVNETIIWLDSAKNREIVPLLNMGLPVRVIVPKGCDVIFKEQVDQIVESGPMYGEIKERLYHTKAGDVKHPVKEWVKMKNHPEVIEVDSAGTAWYAVKKKHINIFCFRNAFDKSENRFLWMGELFTTLSLWTRRGIMPHIYPFVLFGDEAHWFNAGQKITSDSSRGLLSELITEHALEIRAYGGRLILFAQGYKNLPPATRENLQHNLLCRGVKISSEENNTLSVFNSRTSLYSPDEGLFVFEGGITFPHNRPWKFTFFPMPKIKVEYKGFFDEVTPQRAIEEELEQELMPDISRYTELQKDLQNYTIPANIGRYDVIDNV